MVDLPTIEGLEDIAGYYLDKIRHDDYLTAERVAMMMAGRTPSDVRQVIRKGAVQLATIGGAKQIYYRHFQRALAEATMGDKQPLALTERERECLAYHEAGHAVALLAIAGDRMKPAWLTTERYGRALGHMYPVEAVQWRIGRTQTMIEAAIVIFMAGMAAEEVFLGERHNSAGGDMPAIHSLLKQMFLTGMMDEWHFAAKEDREKELMKGTADRLYERAKDVLGQNEDAHVALVAALMEKKELTEPEIVEAVEGKIVEQ